MYGEFQNNSFQELLSVMGMIGQMRENYLKTYQVENSKISEKDYLKMIELLDQLMDDVWGMMDVGRQPVIGHA